MAPLMIINQINTLSYFDICLVEDSDEITDLQNQRTVEIESRDFAGLDCNDGFMICNDRTSFEDRGAHPYGEGIDRYRSLEDLSDSEIELLQEARRHVFSKSIESTFFRYQWHTLFEGTLEFSIGFCANSFRIYNRCTFWMGQQRITFSVVIQTASKSNGIFS